MIVCDVSVIIPAHNAQLTIDRALKSVVDQTILPREVIVVDDGSTDNTYRVAKEWLDRMHGINLVVLRQANAGPGAARNYGISIATSKHVAFLDSDDEWLSEKLAKSLKQMQKSGACLVSHNGWICEDNKKYYLDISSRYQRAKANNFIHGLYRRGFISTSSVIARKIVITDLGGFDETLMTGQDFDLWLRIANIPGESILVFDDALTNYHIYGDSVTRNTGRRLSDTMEIARRHIPLLGRSLVKTLPTIWFRVVALNMEASTAYWARGAHRHCLLIAGRLPVDLLRLTWVAVLQRYGR